jgi:uncharacterized protein YcfJ
VRRGYAGLFAPAIRHLFLFLPGVTINRIFMSTSKFILSVLGAAAAGVVIGSIVSSGKGGELVERIKNLAGDWLGKKAAEGNEAMEGNETAEQRAEFNQANAPGQV